MRRLIATSALSILVFGAAVLLGACGGDDGGESSASRGGGDAAGLVSVSTIDGTDVLVDAEGRVLYSAEQEAAGKILCTASCLSIWDPLEASAEDAGSTEVDADLGVVERPDGGEQLTLDDRPLYRFNEEGPGELTGELVDEFEGTEFEWTAATVDVAADTDAPPSEEPSEPPAGGFDY